MQKNIATPKVRSNTAELDISYRETLLRIIEESRSWLEIKQITLLSDISLAKCKALLPQLATQGLIATMHKSSPRQPDGTLMYAKLSVAKSYATKRECKSGFEHAKSRFECWPGLLEGKNIRPYHAQPSQLKSLAMLARKP